MTPLFQTGPVKKATLFDSPAYVLTCQAGAYAITSLPYWVIKPHKQQHHYGVMISDNIGKTMLLYVIGYESNADYDFAQAESAGTMCAKRMATIARELNLIPDLVITESLYESLEFPLGSARGLRWAEDGCPIDYSEYVELPTKKFYYSVDTPVRVWMRESFSIEARTQEEADAKMKLAVQAGNLNTVNGRVFLEETIDYIEPDTNDDFEQPLGRVFSGLADDWDDGNTLYENVDGTWREPRE